MAMVLKNLLCALTSHPPVAVHGHKPVWLGDSVEQMQNILLLFSHQGLLTMVLKSLLWSKQELSMVTTHCSSYLFSEFKDLF